MQALAERLAAAIGGHRLVGADALGFTALKTVTPSPEALLGHVVDEVDRRGKYVLLSFDDGNRIAMHLSQAGRVDIEEKPKTTRPKGAVVRLRFATGDGEPGPAVLVREHGTERKAAWWVLAPGDPGPLEGLGPEPDSDEFAELVLRGADTRRIHTWLRDQRTVAGVGRGYADDALWRACISPTRRSRSSTTLSAPRCSRQCAPCSVTDSRRNGVARAVSGAEARHQLRGARPRRRQVPARVARHCGTSPTSRTRSCTALPARPVARCSPTAACRGSSSDRTTDRSGDGRGDLVGLAFG